jgi:hypothetical protein
MVFNLHDPIRDFIIQRCLSFKVYCRPKGFAITLWQYVPINVSQYQFMRDIQKNVLFFFSVMSTGLR